MNPYPIRNSATYQGQPRLQQLHTVMPSALQSVTHHQRPSPQAYHRPSDQSPFGPQIPLQIGGRRRRPHHLQAPIPLRGFQANNTTTTTTTNTTTNRPVFNFFDSTFRSYAERIQTELTHLRAVCNKVMFRERQDRDKWRAHCMTFKRERDDARERVRVLMDGRENLRRFEVAPTATGDSSDGESSSGRGVKRTREGTALSHSLAGTFKIERSSRNVSPHPSSSSSPSSTTAANSDSEHLDEDEESGVYTLSFPDPGLTLLTPFAISASPVSPSFPPPKRCRSAGPVLCSTNTFGNVQQVEGGKDREADRSSVTGFDSTRHFSGQPKKDLLELVSSPPPQSSTFKHLESSTSTPYEGLDMDETSASLLDRLSKCGDQKPGDEVTTLKKNQSPSPRQSTESSGDLPISGSSQITAFATDEIHIDIMYITRGEMLECRVCSLWKSKRLVPGAATPARFPVNAKWEDLRDHCAKEHPRECKDVARLEPVELHELRKRIYASRLG